MVKLTKKDQEDIDKTLAEEGNLKEEHHLQTDVKPSALSNAGGMGIEGLEQIPAGMISMPFVRIVQPSSKNTKMADGSEAPNGSFLFNDTQEAYDELDFVMLGAKFQYRKTDDKGNFVPDDYVGVTKQKAQVTILGMLTEDEKIFILSLSPTSFSNWGRLMAKFKSIKLDKTWRFAIKATTEMTENTKGKYAVADFQLGEEITGELFKSVSEKVAQYGASLNRVQFTEEE